MRNERQMQIFESIIQTLVQQFQGFIQPLIFLTADLASHFPFLS